MAEHTVTFKANTWFTVKVEAEDRDAAIEKAGEQLPPQLCFQCAGWDQKWTLEIPDDPACWEAEGD